MFLAWATGIEGGPCIFGITERQEGKKSQGHIQTIKYQIINCKKNVLQTHIASKKICSSQFEQNIVLRNRSIINNSGLHYLINSYTQQINAIFWRQ